MSLRERFHRLRRWEFWPAWAVYAPVAPFIAAYALRARSVTACIAVNAHEAFGVIIGESKFAILNLLPKSDTVASQLIASSPLDARCTQLSEFMSSRKLTWPIVLKPDVGERGTGVRLIRDVHAARDYLSRYHAPVLAQEFHPGPGELGVFYIRDPRSNTGELFSLTDKRFPSVVGDGRRTIEALIRDDPRLHLQSHVFLRRLGSRAQSIPSPKQLIPLAFAGNHCRGTTFLDGSHLATPELLAAFDRISHASPGVYFGRFDVRYESPELLKQGRGFKILELNGLLSEPTHIYHPGYGYWRAQTFLRKQWKLAFRIGAFNARTGTRVPPISKVIRDIRTHIARPDSDADSD